ncbi:MAG TPA: phytanoyl-CoA dioxygenase family protein [Acidimicrobiales bacterium]|nr:phytanoyl-CoA dioxygenase family protein [Acidimicrobiales bacterium]
MSDDRLDVSAETSGAGTGVSAETSGEGIDAERVAATVLANGFAVVPRVLDADQVAAKRRSLEPWLDRTEFGANSFLGRRTRRVYSVLAKVRTFDDALLHPLVLGVADRVLGHYQMCVSTAVEIHPGEPAQTLHADDGVYPLPTSVGPLTLNTMWALDDFTEANGATRMVPGTHRRPEKRLAEADEVVVADMPAGSVLLYLGSLLHGGGANTTDRPRLGVVLEYSVSWLRPQENLGLTYPPDLVRDLPERLQELLGYNLYPPFLGYVDGKDPKELLRPPPAGPEADAGRPPG